MTAEATEECFQRTPMDFVGDKQWIQYGDFKDDPFGDGMNASNRVEIDAVRVTLGTMPQGSAWTRNPIPGCSNIPFMGSRGHPCGGPMFPPPAPGASGFGQGSCLTPGALPCTAEQYIDTLLPFGIVDLLRVPDVPAGDYMLSFRWDMEQSAQIWSNCADVKIVEAARAEPEHLNTKPFSPWRGCELCCAETLGPCANCTGCANNKDGDCAYCWRPLPGTQPLIARFQCLGHESADGGPGVFNPAGGLGSQLWSPGCTKCWGQKDSCKPRDRDVIEFDTADPTSMRANLV